MSRRNYFMGDHGSVLAGFVSQPSLALAFLYAWLLSIGSRTIRAGYRHLVDRKDRRDLSLFQIGLRFIDRKLLRFRPISVLLCAYS
jgi:hypothetical protein